MPISCGSVSDRPSSRPAAAKEHDKAVLSHRPHDQVHAGNLDLLEEAAQARAGLGRNSTGATVGDQALGIHRAEVAPCGEVLVGELQVDPDGFQYAPPDAELERIVSEKAEVSRSAPRRDPRRDGVGQPQRPLGSQRVQMRRLRRLQLRLAVERARQPADAVHHQQDDLRLGRPGQRLQVVERDHPRPPRRRCIVPKDLWRIIPTAKGIVQRSARAGACSPPRLPAMGRPPSVTPGADSNTALFALARVFPASFVLTGTRGVALHCRVSLPRGTSDAGRYGGAPLNRIVGALAALAKAFGQGH